MRRPRPFVVLFVLGLATLGLGLAIKAPCLERPWEDFANRSLCYTDVGALYVGRHLDADTFPYSASDQDDPADPDVRNRRGFNEYPPLVALYMWSGAKLGTLRSAVLGGADTANEYFAWQVGGLALAALGIILLLWRLGEDPKRIALVAGAPALAMQGFVNYDLLPAFLSLLGLYLFERGRWGASGLAFAAGAAAKLYPLLFVPIVAVHLLRARTEPSLRARFSGAWHNGPLRRFLLGTLVGLAVLTVPFLVWADASLFLEVFRFHAARYPSGESFWGTLWYLAAAWDPAPIDALGGPATINALSAALFGTAYAWVLYATWKGRVGTRAACMAAVLAFLVFNKVFSLQYTLWLLPFWGLVPVDRRWYAAFAVTDVLGFASLLPLVDLPFGSAEWKALYGILALSAVARTAGYAALAIHLVRRRDAGPASTSPVARRALPALWATVAFASFLAGQALRAHPVRPPLVFPETLPPLFLVAAVACLLAAALALLVAAPAVVPPSKRAQAKPGTVSGALK